jgi:hypothetical protein
MSALLLKTVFHNQNTLSMNCKDSGRGGCLACIRAESTMTAAESTLNKFMSGSYAGYLHVAKLQQHASATVSKQAN